MTTGSIWVTLTQHAFSGLGNPSLGPQYSTLMTQIGVAGKLIAAQVRQPSHRSMGLNR